MRLQMVLNIYYDYIIQFFVTFLLYTKRSLRVWGVINLSLEIQQLEDYDSEVNCQRWWDLLLLN